LCSHKFIVSLNNANTNFSICIDFGDHQVSYVSFNITPVGGPPDAPAHLRIKFGETLCEIAEDSASYNGSISSSWIQEEFMHVDILPNTVNMPRRYAFRYMEIKVLHTSPKYQIVIEDVNCTAVSSADLSAIAPLTRIDEDLVKMDKISIKTLQDCMQSVFEDGPTYLAIYLAACFVFPSILLLACILNPFFLSLKHQSIILFNSVFLGIAFLIAVNIAYCHFFLIIP